MLTAAKKLHEPKLVHFRLDDFIYTHCIHVITTLQSKLVKPRYGFIFQKKKIDPILLLVYFIKLYKSCKLRGHQASDQLFSIAAKRWH